MSNHFNVLRDIVKASDANDGDSLANAVNAARQKLLAGQVNCLRELVMAHHAVKRAYDEFYDSIGTDSLTAEQQSAVDSFVVEWLEDDAPDDARDVTESHLHYIFSNIPTDGV